MFSCFIRLAGEEEEMNSENITWLFLFCHSHRRKSYTENVKTWRMPEMQSLLELDFTI